MLRDILTTFDDGHSDDFSLRQGEASLDTFSLDASSGLWPRAGAFGARAVLPPCAHLLWCELCAMKGVHQKIMDGYTVSSRCCFVSEQGLGSGSGLTLLELKGSSLEYI